MNLSAPFIPDPDYVSFLTRCQGALSALYFPLFPGPVLDSRIRSRVPGQPAAPDLDALTQWLTPLAGTDLYILANTRFTAPDLYSDTRRLKQFLDAVQTLHTAVGIRGLVVADAYLVNALALTGHGLIPELELIPGVNAMLDNRDKFLAWADLIDASGFRLPGRLIPDRALNRDLPGLRKLTKEIRTLIPGCRIELLANEGCILQCPFKPAHDAHISLSNMGLVEEATCHINRRTGCHQYLLSDPCKFLKSPFIRPEDIPQYQGIADGIKLAGRTCGTSFLKRCIRAYRDGFYKGNLFELMDAAGFMAQHFHLDNTALGADFFKSLTTCTNRCKHCRICGVLFEKAAHKKISRFNQYKDIS